MRFPVAAAAVCLASLQPPPALGEPDYTDDGELRLPADYATWVFVGSNLGLAYADEVPQTTAREAGRADHEMFHNVYMEPDAYLQFMQTGAFRDPTEMLFEVYTAESKDPGEVLTEGLFNGRLVAVEMAVKDSDRPTHEGSTEIWAYYAFEGETIPATATAMPDSACFACHAEHADYDNVWVQFYPRLRARLAQ